MSLRVDVASETAVPLSRARVSAAAMATLRSERVRHALLSITFLDAASIARLNRAHLRRRGATDVIAFGFTRTSDRDPVVGDIYIAPAVARANAREHRRPVREELTRLVVHGTLHVLGYDHPETEWRTRSPMWKKQEALVRRLIARPA